MADGFIRYRVSVLLNDGVWYSVFSPHNTIIISISRPFVLRFLISVIFFFFVVVFFSYSLICSKNLLSINRNERHIYPSFVHKNKLNKYIDALSTQNVSNRKSYQNKPWSNNMDRCDCVPLCVCVDKWAMKMNRPEFRTND